MLYRRRLELDIEEVRPELDILRQATKELKTSDRFKQVLKTILMIGNTLNGSSFRGNARGFQLEALLKMKETKTAKSSPECPTLLHYIARVLLKSDPERVNFLDDMPHLEAAARSELIVSYAYESHHSVLYSFYAGCIRLCDGLVYWSASSAF